MDSAFNPLAEPYGPLEEAASIPVATRWIGSWRFSLQRRAMSARQLESRKSANRLHAANQEAARPKENVK